MTDSVHQMSLLVGELKGKLDAVVASVENLNRVWGQREQAATDGRRVLHEKIEDLQHDFMRLEATVENASRDISVLKPAIEAFKTAKAEQEGAQQRAQQLGTRLWAVFIAMAGIVGAVAAKLIDKMWGTH